ncbi:MAG TPA: citryl-CoA lyase [Burkholderiales bacterium]|jgi:citrate synthase|nr:citryl-CoA lyase [Burkholderiales bacterium]
MSVTTNIAHSDERTITIRGKDLVGELIGRRSFTEMVFFLVRNRFPTAEEARILDACLVTLMEHGLTPSAIVTRMLADNVPGQAQVAMAAGLLAVGDVFVGTIEGCARLLKDGMEGAATHAAYCRDVVAQHLARRAPLPGFGHRLHKPDDPRAVRLLALGAECNVKGDYARLLKQLSEELDRASGRHITINATGAIAALLLEIGMPLEVMRPIAVLSRCGGLPGHILEDKKTGSGRYIWRLVDDSIAYQPPAAE